MSGTKVSGNSNTTTAVKTSQGHILTVKGLVLSILVVSSAIPFFLMVPEASPALAQPSVIETITGLTNARDVAYDPVHERMYVTGGPSENVYIIDVNTNIETSDSPITIPDTTLNRIAYDPEHGRMYVTDLATNNLHVIDTNTNTQVMGTPIDIGSRSIGIAYNPDNKMMYVSAVNDNTVKIVDTDTNTVNPVSIALTAGFGSPLGIAYDPDHQRMYVTRVADPGKVDIVDTTNNMLDTTHGPVDVGLSPQFGIAYDPVHQTMYVPNRDTSDVSVIDTDTGMDPNEVIATINGIGTPFGIAYDPVNEEMYVTEGISVPSNVRVIDTNTNTLVGDAISVGSAPAGIAYEPVHERMYVANQVSDSVSVIQIPQEEDDPVTAIQDQITDTESLEGVPNGVKQSLISQLRNALRFVSDDSTSNDFISCERMDNFVALVNTFENRGFLTEAQADDLLQQAEAIKDTIGCSNSGTSSAQDSDIAAGTAMTSTRLPQSSNPDNTDTMPSVTSLRQ